MIERLILNPTKESAPSTGWILVRSYEQKIEDEDTTPPIESFTSGFKGTSIDTLADFQTSQVPEYTGMLTPETFAVLDERSEKDDSVIIVHRMTSYPDKDPEDLDPDPSLEKKEWTQWRVSFLAADFTIANLEESSELSIGEGDDSYLVRDENGMVTFGRSPPGYKGL